MYEGKLVSLRAVEPEDGDLLYRWMNDPDVIARLAVRYPLSRKSEQEWIEQHSMPSYDAPHFAIETVAERRLIGGCGFHVTIPENRYAELGISIGDKSVWGRGYGTDAMRTLCRFGFEMMNLHRIGLWVDETNTRAQAVYERVGFVTEGRARQAWFKHGEWRDMILMGLIEGELRLED